MKRICAWHKGNFGFGLVMEEGNAWVEMDAEPATHGICSECYAKEIRSIRQAVCDDCGQQHSVGAPCIDHAQVRGIYQPDVKLVPLNFRREPQLMDAKVAKARLNIETSLGT